MTDAQANRYAAYLVAGERVTAARFLPLPAHAAFFSLVGLDRIAELASVRRCSPFSSKMSSTARLMTRPSLSTERASKTAPSIGAPWFIPVARLSFSATAGFMTVDLRRKVQPQPHCSPCRSPTNTALLTGSPKSLTGSGRPTQCSRVAIGQAAFSLVGVAGSDKTAGNHQRGMPPFARFQLDTVEGVSLSAFATLTVPPRLSIV